MPTIAKPFRRGKCQVCHSEEYQIAGRLCLLCERYACQDFKSLREQPLLLRTEELAFRKEAHLPLILNGKIPDLEKIMEKSSLTPQQKKIIKLYFTEDQTYEQISLTLGISKSSVQTQMSRAIEKLKVCHSNSHIVRSKEADQETQMAPSETKARVPGLRKPKPKSIDPYLYYSKCRDCHGTDLIGQGNRGSCNRCGWTFAVYSVEEVQNSHPWPAKPILDGSEY